MSASGAKVLQLRSVEYARNYGVRIHVRPSFGDGSGTLVLGEEETMERPLVTAVTHSTEDARVTLTGVPDQPGVAARIFGALAEADVNVDMIIQNEPVSAQAQGGAVLHGAEERPRGARRTLEALAGELGLDERDRGRGDGHGLDRRRGHAQPSRRRGEGVPDARRTRDQHRDDLDLADQDLVRHPSRPGPRRRRGAARRLRARREPTEAGEHDGAERPARRGRGRDRRRRLDDARGDARARLPGREVVPFASERSAGRRIEHGGRAARGARARRRTRSAGFDLALFSAGGSVSREWAPRFAEAGCVVVDNSSAWRMDERRAARRRRGQSGRPRRATGHRRQPELLDDADGDGAEADPRRGRHRARDRLHLPVDVRHGAARPSRRCAQQARRAARGPRESRPSVYPHQIAFNVLPQVETFKDGDDYTTEERKMMAETRKILGDDAHPGLADLRARARLRRALGVDQRPDARGPLARALPRDARARFPAWSSSTTRRRPLPDADRRRRPRRRARRAHPPRPDARALPEPVGRRRQPAQGRRHQRRAARRAAGGAGLVKPGRRVEPRASLSRRDPARTRPASRSLGSPARPRRRGSSGRCDDAKPRWDCAGLPAFMPSSSRTDRLPWISDEIGEPDESYAVELVEDQLGEVLPDHRELLRGRGLLEPLRGSPVAPL